MPADAATTHRVVVGARAGRADPRGARLKRQLAEDLGVHVDDARVFDVYTIRAALTPDELERVRTELFTDPVIEESALDTALAPQGCHVIEVGFRPGVTDNAGKSSRLGFADVLGRPLDPGEAVYTSTQYALTGPLTPEHCDRIARDLLANGLIQRWTVFTPADSASGNGTPPLGLPVVTERSDPVVHPVNLEVTGDELMALSRDGLLALELAEMQAIQAYYRREDVRNARRALGLSEQPADIELEILAQTWSEHCKHKIFAAGIDYTDPAGARRFIDGLFKTCIKGTTDRAAKDIDWLVSVFDDNAGIIRFNENWNFALKAETHNSPSALDPYGGAMTGIVGVNRDIIGAGLGCRCIFNTDVFCVASPEYEGPIPPRLFHPKRVLRGVHSGVKDGGNESGIPDINGAIVFHERFLGKPLVFCGTGGLIPARINGRPSHEKRARPGDYIVMAGGRIGKDGIHGATFSSEELHEGSPATAVQIGDPITQKKMADFLIEARDRGLYTCITDNGAGGLSSSVGEMARGPGGAQVHLDRAPLKYPGLAPWEIFLSEAQERMTLAVPPDTFDELARLAARREVEVTNLGAFTDSGLLEAFFNGERIGAIHMDFLHNGVPRMRLEARLDPPAPEPQIELTSRDLAADLKAVLGALNVCSKESFVRMYDHEVQGHSVLKPFQGANMDGPGDAAVIRPLPDAYRGLAVACGICPKYSDLDCYAMTAAAVDEAVRNLVCVGARLGAVAGLDNFCWPDPIQSEKTPDGRHKLAQLVRSCEALHDVCVAYDIPLISGKDSMKNDYKIGDTKISIPPTLLFTAVAVLDDVRKAVSMDAKNPGHFVYVLGETLDEMGGSEYLALQGRLGATAPQVDTTTARNRYECLAQAIDRGLVASAHDCSDGGLGPALAETAFAGNLGMELDIAPLGITNPVVALFSESQSRFVVTVSPEHQQIFEETMQETVWYSVGKVTESPVFQVKLDQDQLISASIAELKAAWQRTLDW